MKGIFPKETFERIQKRDGYIAIIFFVTYFLLSFVYLDFTKHYIKSNTYIQNKALKQLIVGMPFYLIAVIAIFIILKIRKQSMATIGLRRKGLLVSMGIGLFLTGIVYIGHIVNGYPPINIFYHFIFFVIVLGFSEEIIFRGFIWPRLVVLLGNKYGTIWSGAFFGIMHAPFKIVVGNSHFLLAILSEVGGGIVASLFFIWLYTRKNNIVLPSMIHGVLDFMQKPL